VLEGVDTTWREYDVEVPVRVKHRQGNPKRRTVYSLVGAGPHDAFGVHNASLTNLRRGVIERVFLVDYGKGLVPPIRPDPAEFRLMIKPAERYIKRHAMFLGPLTHTQFIEKYAGDARKQARYRDASASLARQPVCRQDAEIKTFTKAEKTNFTAKCDPAPRVISPRDTRFNLALGVYIKPIEGVLYKVLNDMFGGPTVMKGMNMSEVGECVADAWNCFSHPVAVGGDAKRFDQHTGPEALKFEARIYQRFFTGQDLEEIRRLLQWQRKSVCRGFVPEGSVKFDFDIRASGDMNTGLGTCLIACSTLYSYCQLVDLNCRLIDNGDDFVVICEQADLHKLDGLHDFCLKLGYFMVMEDPVFELEKMEFCQTHPVWDGEGYRMVRNYPSAIGKDMVSVLPLTDTKSWSKWANDVGQCGMALNSGIPILQSFYECLGRSGSGSFGLHPWSRYSGSFLASRGMDASKRKISQRARYSFYLAFDVSPAEQEHIEEYYERHDYDLSCVDLQGYSLQFLNKPTHTHYQTHFDK